MALPNRRNYPKKLYVGDSFYRIKFCKFTDKSLCGLCDPTKKTISISKDLSPVVTLQTFLHELFHALLQFEMGKSIATHAQIYEMEKRFASFLIDNWFIDEDEPPL